MITVEHIYDALDPFIDRKTIRPDSDLNLEQGISGDDFDIVISEYAETFSVDMTSFCWYFHMSEEGSFYSIGAFFFNPPNKRVPYIAVTPQMLADFANMGKWDIDYPPHEIPKRRWDIFINQMLIVVYIICFLYSLLI